MKCAMMLKGFSESLFIMNMYLFLQKKMFPSIELHDCPQSKILIFQEKLEKLLILFPPEEVEARRWEKIAKALGNRTSSQVLFLLINQFFSLWRFSIKDCVNAAKKFNQWMCEDMNWDYVDIRLFLSANSTEICFFSRVFWINPHGFLETNARINEIMLSVLFQI